MRIALVSDLHANLAAWNAVLADIAVRSADKIICLGDIVGYGPEPAEVLSSAYANIDYFVLGNHDAVAGDLMEPKGFNPIAREIIEHARAVLGDRAKEFFNKVSLLLKHRDFTVSHGSAAAPEKFAYVLGKQDSLELWNATGSGIVCLGHTHIPRLHQLSPDGRYRRFRPSERAFHLKPEHRYIINCGSVGFSRDGDFRASYVILDTGARTVRWHRAAYDLQAFRNAVRRAYPDEKISGFLLGRIEQGARRPVRELIDFTPGRSHVSGDVVAQKELKHMQSRLKRWKLIAAAIFLLALMSAAVTMLHWHDRPRHRRIETADSRPLTPRMSIDGWRYDYLSQETPHERPLPGGWAAALSDARRQSVRLEQGQLLVSSERRQPLTVSLRPICTAETGSIRWELQGSTCKLWQGQPPVLVIDYIGADGTIREGADSIVLRHEDGRLQRQTTINLRADTAGVRPHLQFRSKGSVVLYTVQTVLRPTDEKKLLLQAPMDMNTAAAQQIESIPGIGPALAARIVEYREEINGFENVEDLLKVHGIGEKLLEDIKKYVVINGK